MKRVRSSDGTNLAIEEGGNPDGQPLVFLHGIAQSRHAWRPLFDGRLAQKHRLITVDLRGHGDSDAPLDAYGPMQLGNDVQAVVAGLEKPIIVAWSYGGVAIGEYLRHHGGEELGGIVLVAAATCVGKTARAFFGPAMMDHARALMSEDAAVYEAGARAFVAACPALPISPADAESALTQMLRVPAHVRRALLSRSEDFNDDIARSKVPLTILQGGADKVVLSALARRTAALRPDARFIELPGVGHLPFLEAQPAFEAALKT